MPIQPLDERRMRRRFRLAAAGSVLAAAAVALSAYAAHATLGEAERDWLVRAWQLGLAHGIALAALSPLAVRRWAFYGLGLVLAGTLLFSGSLLLHALATVPAALAPVGGGLMIVGWLLHALGHWRR